MMQLDSSITQLVALDGISGNDGNGDDDNDE
jgi:hypothetical protein